MDENLRKIATTLEVRFFRGRVQSSTEIQFEKSQLPLARSIRR